MMDVRVEHRGACSPEVKPTHTSRHAVPTSSTGIFYVFVLKLKLIYAIMKVEELIGRTSLRAAGLSVGVDVQMVEGRLECKAMASSDLLMACTRYSLISSCFTALLCFFFRCKDCDFL